MATTNTRYFAASTFDVHQDGNSWVTFKVATIELLMYMGVELPSWTLLAGCSAFTGLPNSVLHLWQLTDASALYQGKAYFEGLPGMKGTGGRRFYDTLIEMSGATDTLLLEAMPYDPQRSPTPGAKPPSKDGRFYFLWVELTLLPGDVNRGTFCAAAQELLGIMKTELPTWKLVAAGSTITGPTNTVMHLWQLDDANALLEGMNWFGENNRPYSTLARCCVRQKQQLFTSMSYNPLGKNNASAQDEEDVSTLKEIRDRFQLTLQDTKEAD